MLVTFGYRKLTPDFSSEVSFLIYFPLFSLSYRYPVKRYARDIPGCSVAIKESISNCRIWRWTVHLVSPVPSPDFLIRRCIAVLFEVFHQKHIDIVSGCFSLFVFALAVIHSKNGSSAVALSFSARAFFNRSADSCLNSSETCLGGLTFT